MKRSKWMAAAATALCLVMALSGCGGKDEDKKETNAETKAETKAETSAETAAPKEETGAEP